MTPMENVFLPGQLLIILFFYVGAIQRKLPIFSFDTGNLVEITTPPSRTDPSWISFRNPKIIYSLSLLESIPKLEFFVTIALVKQWMFGKTH